MAPRIHLAIDTLRLHGFESHERDRLVGAMESELQRLMEATRRQAPFGRDHGWMHREHARIDTAPGADPEHAGTTAARALFDHFAVDSGGSGGE